MQLGNVARKDLDVRKRRDEWQLVIDDLDHLDCELVLLLTIERRLETIPQPVELGVRPAHAVAAYPTVSGCGDLGRRKPGKPADLVLRDGVLRHPRILC